MMFRRVLVPLDGSESALKVLPLAARLAPGAGWTFLTTVDLAWADDGISPYTESLMKDAGGRLRRLAEQWTPALKSIETRVTVGDPSEAILGEAKPDAFDLVAMTTHGRSGLTRWLLGSVAEKVLRGSDIPVLVARSALGAKEEPIRRIALTLDGFPSSEQALPLARHLARQHDAGLRLIHVIEPNNFSTDTELGRVVLDRLTRLELRVREVHAKLEGEGLTTEVVVTHGDPASRILDYCREHPVDLLVIATHGRRGIQRWTLGSVTERVLRAAEMPLLVTRCR